MRMLTIEEAERAEAGGTDKLVTMGAAQLCDAISLPNGACIMEKRLVESLPERES